MASREALQGLGELETGLDWDGTLGFELGLPEMMGNWLTFKKTLHASQLPKTCCF